MALVRCVTEMGMGVDVHGLDYTNAAKRAVFDAIHHSSLGFPRLVGKTADDMRVEVTIGVPKPEAVDKKAVLETLPHGRTGLRAFSTNALAPITADDTERRHRREKNDTLLHKLFLSLKI